VGVSFAKKESDIIGNEYDVVLTDGSKMEFTSKGEWKSVECKGGAVPADIVPKQIKQYVAKNYPDAKILKIDRDYREYEVYLSNRLELTFNKDFKLVDIDD
jgi:predicted nucleotide-binding protein (sugar kinase/HSP70/actin superfamily)